MTVGAKPLLGHPQHSPAPKFRKHLDRRSRKIRREPEHLLQADIPWTWQCLHPWTHSNMAAFTRPEKTTPDLIWLKSASNIENHELNSTFSVLYISLKMGHGAIKATDLSVCKRGSDLPGSWNLAGLYVLQVWASTPAFVLQASAISPGFSALPLLFLPLLSCHHLLTSSEKVSFTNSHLFSPSRVFSKNTCIQ